MASERDWHRHDPGDLQNFERIQTSKKGFHPAGRSGGAAGKTEVLICVVHNGEVTLRGCFKKRSEMKKVLVLIVFIPSVIGCEKIQNCSANAIWAIFSIGGSGYHVKGDKVYQYTHSLEIWSDYEVVGADPKTFEPITTSVGRDAKHVFHNCDLVHDADPYSFRLVGKEYWKDDSRVYWLSGCYTEVLKMADPKAFELLEDYPWAADKKRVYYDSVLVCARDDGFEPVNSKWARDNKNYYFTTKVVRGIDGPTFEVLGEEYARDKNHVYFDRDVAADCDPKKFRVLESIYGTDGKYYYACGKKERLLTDEDKKRFGIK